MHMQWSKDFHSTFSFLSLFALFPLPLLFLLIHSYKWVVELRYKELHALHKKVAKQLPGYMQFTFPPKRFQQMPQRRASASLVEKRRVLLEAWLDGVLSLPETIGNEDMRTHLQVPDEVRAYRCSQQARFSFSSAPDLIETSFS